MPILESSPDQLVSSPARQYVSSLIHKVSDDENDLLNSISGELLYLVCLLPGVLGDGDGGGCHHYG